MLMMSIFNQTNKLSSISLVHSGAFCNERELPSTGAWPTTVKPAQPPPRQNPLFRRDFAVVEAAAQVCHFRRKCRIAARRFPGRSRVDVAVNQKALLDLSWCQQCPTCPLRCNLAG